MKRMSIERQMKAMEIISKWHDYDLNFNMDIKFNYGIRINNLASFGCCEIKDLSKAGFLVSITSNLGHTEDGYGFQVNVYDRQLKS